MDSSPEYIFPDPQDASDANEAATRKKVFFSFQGMIHGKILKDIFDLKNILSKISSKEPVSSKQQLKVWSDPTNRFAPDSYVSFFANNETDWRHLEFPISWFDDKVGCEEQTTVKISFIDEVLSDKPKLKKAKTTREKATGSKYT
jgi:hypothetical protein